MKCLAAPDIFLRFNESTFVSFFFSFFFLPPICRRLCLKRVWACDFPIPNFVSERTLKISNRAIDR